MKKFLLLILCMFGVINGSLAAQVDTNVVCKLCVPVVTVDTVSDTIKIISHVDTIWKDSLGTKISADTTYRDSIIISQKRFPLEPLGNVKVTELTFNTSGEGGWGAAGGYITAIDAPCDGPSVRRYTKSLGNQTVNSFSPGLSKLNIVGRKELYFYGCFRISPTYDGNTSNTNKLGPFFGLAKGVQIFFNAQGKGVTSPLYAHINVQGLVPSAGGVTATGDGTFGGSVAQIVRGKWYAVVITLNVNTWGQNNGTLAAWLIDLQTKTQTQFVSKTGLGYIGTKTYPVTTSSSVFDLLTMNAIWGGGLGVISSPTWIDWDFIYVSGK